MARGFESKDVEFQQAEAERRKSSVRTFTADERRRDARQRTIELALVRARHELMNAVRPAHRAMLEGAIGDLEAQLDAQRPSTLDRHS
jgi:hypothetical protein